MPRSRRSRSRRQGPDAPSDRIPAASGRSRRIEAHQDDAEHIGSLQTSVVWWRGEAHHVLCASQPARNARTHLDASDPEPIVVPPRRAARPGHGAIPIRRRRPRSTPARRTCGVSKPDKAWIAQVRVVRLDRNVAGGVSAVSGRRPRTEAKAGCDPCTLCGQLRALSVAAHTQGRLCCERQPAPRGRVSPLQHELRASAFPRQRSPHRAR